MVAWVAGELTVQDAIEVLADAVVVSRAARHGDGPDAVEFVARVLPGGPGQEAVGGPLGGDHGLYHSTFRHGSRRFVMAFWAAARLG